MKEKRQFPIFNSPIDLAHQFWEKVLEQGGWAIDATCGNGYDTLCLARLIAPEAGVIGLDMQEKAIQNTKNLFKLQGQDLAQVHFFCQSHAEFPSLAKEKPIRLIVYNLGYLPGGDKSLTTLVDSTLQSIHKALDLLLPQGVVSITCYPGHSEGEREEKALQALSEQLDPKIWSSSFHSWKNRQSSPSLLIIQKSNC